ncbi:MAG: histidine phosphatase family protein [Cellulomonas sp.]
MSTTVWLARHGRTAWHRPVRYAGSSDVELDAVGCAQAERLADWAAGQDLTSLACSTLSRARATAGPIAERTGLTAILDDRLCEPDFGIAEGRTIDELRADSPGAAAAYERDPSAHPWPGAEKLNDVAARGTAAVVAAVARDQSGRVLIVAHSTLIRVVVCSMLGIALSEYRRALPRLDPTSRTLITVRDDGSMGLLGYNMP